MQKSKCKNQKAFTFLEIIIAIGIFAIGILAVISVSAKSFKTISLQQDKLIATNLAKEGIENIRNVRDENWFYRGSSDCNNDNTINLCTNGQIYENEGDCDWRCGNEKNNQPNYKPTYKLDNHLQDIDYLGNAIYNSSIDYTTKTCANDGAVLKIDSNSFYQHTGATDSIFKRLISIKRNNDLNSDGQTNNDLQVKVMVCWKDRGQWQEVSLEEHLYNWKLEENNFLNWNYKRSITIDNRDNANTLNNYQVLIVLNTQNLIATDKMQSACQDIRFSDGVESLNYWIESGCNTTSTKIWVKVPSIPAFSSKSIYLYYGNNTVSSRSNGNLTFDFFDDFEGTSLDTNKWENINNNVSVANSIITIAGPSSGEAAFLTVPSFTDSVIRTKIKGDANKNWGLVSRAMGSYTQGYLFRFSGVDGTNRVAFFRKAWVTLSSQSYTLPSWTNYNIVELYTIGNTLRGRINDGSLTSSITEGTYTSSKNGLRVVDSAKTSIDWFCVRQYASPEPTITVGEEE